ncbi:MAG: hypothetical protein KME69_19575, partial [Candidatus Thiodiazotropha sp. (ex Codakia orbicularis)]|nr:hypothetical protein [Candidatus Thiodiazotropha sp. (ex Codakia orbicularis)]
ALLDTKTAPAGRIGLVLTDPKSNTCTSDKYIDHVPCSKKERNEAEPVLTITLSCRFSYF